MPNNDDLTRYPLGSNAFPVFDKNVRNLDVAVNDKENECWKDRFGKMRRTWHGMESNFDRFIDASSEEFQQFLINSGYQDMGDYGPGLEITARNQIFWRDGELYRAGASLELPYTTTGDWEAEGSLFVAVGDAALRQQLASPEGASYVGYKSDGSNRTTTTVDEKLNERTSLSDFENYSYGVESEDQIYVPKGNWELPIGLDTSRLFGPGILKVGGNSFIANRNYIEWSNVSCKKTQELNFGYPDNLLFPSATRAMQGIAYTDYGNGKIFMMQRSGGDSYTEEETNRIIEYPFTDDGSPSDPISMSQDLRIGHQGISTLVEDDTLYIYSNMPVLPGTSGSSNAGKGYSKIEWKGDQTSQSDVVFYQLFGDSNSGHKFSNFYSSAFTVSVCGKYIVSIGGKENTSTSSYVFVYERSEVEDSSDPLTVDPISFFKYPIVNSDRAYFNQGIVCDGKFIYVLHGYINPFTQHVIRKMSFQGDVLSEIFVDGIRGFYPREYLFKGHPSYGCPQSMEPEGIAIKDGKLLVVSTDNWRSYGDIVTYRGKNFAFVGSSHTGSPDNSSSIPEWVYTELPANSGEWEEGKSYSRGQITRVGKVIVSIHETEDSIGEFPVNSRITRLPSPAYIAFPNTAYDISFPFGEVLQVGQYGANSEEFRNAIAIGSNQIRIYDGSDFSVNPSERATLYKITTEVDRSLQIRSNVNLSQGGGISLFSNNHPTVTAGSVRFYTGGSTALQLDSANNRALRPGSDAQQPLGLANSRWNTVYASTGSINTSDERLKENISEIEETVFRAWSKVEYSKYKFKDSVQKKGNKARFHFGLIAQRVKEAFESEGLDAFAYGILCYDQWDGQDAEFETYIEEQVVDGEVVEVEIKKEIHPATSSGNQYGIRYEEALALESAYLRYELNKLKNSTKGDNHGHQT